MDKPHEHSHKKVEEDQSPKEEAVVENSSNPSEITQRDGHNSKNKKSPLLIFFAKINFFQKKITMKITPQITKKSSLNRKKHPVKSSKP